jgi:hypothetical protein
MLLNIFQDDAFSLASMTNGLSKVEYVPNQIGALKLFRPMPIRTAVAAIEIRQGTMKLIQTTKRGQTSESRDKRQKGRMEYFETRKIAVDSRITADDLQFMRAFGTEDQIKQLQQEIVQRQTGPGGLLDDVNLTFESMKLSALRGKLLDADGTLLYDYFAKMGVAEPSVVNFSFATLTEGKLREYITNNITLHMEKNAKGARYSQIHCLCGENVMNELHKNTEFTRTFLNQQAAAELRGDYLNQKTLFGGVIWERYRGTDDGTTVHVGPDNMIFFPGGQDNTVYSHIMSPGEKFSQVGQLGQEMYSWLEWDKNEDPAWVDPHVAAYPLMLNQRPEMSRLGTLI